MKHKRLTYLHATALPGLVKASLATLGLPLTKFESYYVYANNFQLGDKSPYRVGGYNISQIKCPRYAQGIVLLLALTDYKIYIE